MLTPPPFVVVVVVVVIVVVDVETIVDAYAAFFVMSLTVLETLLVSVI